MAFREPKTISLRLRLVDGERGIASLKLRVSPERLSLSAHRAAEPRNLFQLSRRWLSLIVRSFAAPARL
jgi:hypothetical protein